MIHIGNKTRVQKAGKYSRCVILTPQLEMLGKKLGDDVYCYVEEKDGKKRIIIEGVK